MVTVNVISHKNKKEFLKENSSKNEQNVRDVARSTSN